MQVRRDSRPGFPTDVFDPLPLLLAHPFPLTGFTVQAVCRSIGGPLQPELQGALAVRRRCKERITVRRLPLLLLHDQYGAPNGGLMVASQSI